MRSEARIFFCIFMLVLQGPMQASDAGYVSAGIILSVEVGHTTIPVPVDAQTTVVAVKAALHKQRCFEEYDPYRRNSTPANMKKPFQEYGSDTQIRIDLYPVTYTMCGLVCQRSEKALQDQENVISIIEQTQTKYFAARLALRTTKDIFSEVSRHRTILEQERKRWEDTKA